MEASHQAGFDFLNEFSGAFSLSAGHFALSQKTPGLSHKTSFFESIDA